jgi:spore coat polysaccharide biosynthesis protein SpsF (cytidylyltransferase family)
MGSSRFPGKVLADLAGYPVLCHVIERAKRAKRVDEVVVATPFADDQYRPIRNLCVDDTPESKHLCWPLSPQVAENDLIGRYYSAATTVEADLIVRLCADNPCVEPSEIDRAVEYYLARPRVFVSNMHQHDTATHPEGLTNRYPDGIGCEVFSRSRLQWMHETIIDPMHREHPHMIFHVRGCVASPRCPLEFARPDVRLDVNTPKDLALLNRLYAHIGGDPLSVHITQLIQAWDALEVQRDRATANRCEHDPI